jgi:UDP-N-acetylmuramate dehydrogenase
MADFGFTPGLVKRLPRVRGSYTENAPLDRVTWFRVGGPAEVLFRPADRADLEHFMSMKPVDVPITVLGVGSNLLVRDGGVPGVVVRLGREFATIEVDGTDIRAGAGALGLNVAMACQQASITGLEFLSGIPGTVGGALRMNAGAFGSEMADVLISARALTPYGRIERLSTAEMGFSYRKCSVAEDWIFLEAKMRGSHGAQADIARRIQQIQAARQSNQPQRVATGGSTFKNPEGKHAWELIEQAGCRGLEIGGAMVSEKHCNFLINLGDASAADIEALGEEVRRRVREETGVELEWEIRRIGVPREGGMS